LIGGAYGFLNPSPITSIMGAVLSQASEPTPMSIHY
jgi:hypothetical protein